MNIKPINPGHALVIPKKHSELVTGMDEKGIGELMIIGARVGNAIRESGIKCNGIAFHLSDGKAAGQ